jgi:hypothetical protein
MGQINAEWYKSNPMLRGSARTNRPGKCQAVERTETANSVIPSGHQPGICGVAKRND